VSLDLGYISREDEALKRHLSVIRAHDTNRPDGFAVPVYFRTPEDEQRRQTYPYIVIDMLNLARDPGREHRGVWTINGANGYYPVGTPTDGAIARTDMPIPMVVTYQVSAVSRFYQHDREMTVQLMYGPLEPRFGALDMGDVVGPDDELRVTDDNSSRRLDILSGPTESPIRDGDRKRLFRTVWTVGMSSEMLLDDIRNVPLVEQVVLQPPTDSEELLLPLG
jgi:hypothetical protein